jgi:hypothetical protein
VRVQSCPPAESGLEQQLEAVFALTRAMVAAGEAQEWERLAGLEQQRRPLLSALFSRRGDCDLNPSRSADDRQRLAEGVRQILEMDRRLIEQGETLKRAIGREIERLRQGRQAVQAYRQADLP